MSAKISQLESFLEKGIDNALVRFGLGSEYLNQGDAKMAEQHLRKALAFNEKYSAAWKLLGKALVAQHQFNEAIQIFEQGIAIAEQKGDVQAVKEMRVFLRRAQEKLTH